MCFASVMLDQKEDRNNDQDDNFQPPTKMRSKIMPLAIVIASLTDLLKRRVRTKYRSTARVRFARTHRLQQLGDANIRSMEK